MTQTESYPTRGSATSWRSGSEAPVFLPAQLSAAVHRVRDTVHLVSHPDGRLGLGLGGEVTQGSGNGHDFPLVASLPPLFPEWLGDRSFGEVHGVRFPYITGAMANGIASVLMVAEAAKAGFLGFFGAAGLSLAQVETAMNQLQGELGPGLAWGSNLIHSPHEPALEEALADLYLRLGVRRVSAAAFMRLTPAIVRYACTGLHRDGAGEIRRSNHVFAKISRLEVARLFLEPAPAPILAHLLERGQLSPEEVDLAAQVPLAENITVEADSGGHTDRRPLTALFPPIAALRDQVAVARGYGRPIRVGVAGGLGTPGAVAAAFALGPAYVVTGSVNQACIESGLAPVGRQMLADAGLADVMMAPAADMFELGVDVQVLQRGTMFGVRARKLYDLYRTYDNWPAVPAAERQLVEQQQLQSPFDEAWQHTRAFWEERDPTQVERAEADPKHLMALVFRSYLGQASRWAIEGDQERQADYQIWCGPAIGAFNAWVRGSFLEEPSRRTVVQVARNLMEGAAVVTRAHQLRSSGLAIPAAAFNFRPRPLD